MVSDPDSVGILQSLDGNTMDILQLPSQELDGCRTPKKNNNLPFCGSSFLPTCQDDKKPAVGMTFNTLVEAEQFYKTYAHFVGFSVRRGAEKVKNDIIVWKRFFCSREGFREEKAQNANDVEKQLDKAKKRKYVRKLTRCGCEAKIVLKRMENGKYMVDKFEQSHTHEFVSPSKKQFIRSNREVSEKVKTSFLTCQKAGIGPSAAFHLIEAESGGFENIGCTKQDVLNYHNSMKYSMKSSNAQMFIDNLNRRKQADPTFFFESKIDDKGRLLHVFWADCICRKNYALFGDIVSFDSTYDTNQYNMIFTPFVGINHHRSSVLFGAALIANEKTESYKWLFESFLKAMGGVAPKLIITDEDLGMKAAIADVFRNTKHRLCMWHIMKKIPEKVGACHSRNSNFLSRLKTCVWESETPKEFESTWSSLISEFGLKEHKWLDQKYEMRELWIPAFYKDLFLGGILRTTSRSESANSFFGKYLCHKLILVEFWSRFESALYSQRHHELLEDNDSRQKLPLLKSSWKLENHARDVFTHKTFNIFQNELLSARDKCDVTSIALEGDLKITSIRDDSGKVREVRYNTSSNIAECSCKFFESEGIPCRHIINSLKAAKLDMLPNYYVCERWTKLATKKCVHHVDGNILEQIPMNFPNPTIKDMSLDIRKKLEEGLRVAEQSEEKMIYLKKIIFDGVDHIIQMGPSNEPSKEQELEVFFGSSIPSEINIHPPGDIHTKGSGKRHKGGLELALELKQKAPRLCKTCNQKGYHDSRNCPIKVPK